MHANHFILIPCVPRESRSRATTTLLHTRNPLQTHMQSLSHPAAAAAEVYSNFSTIHHVCVRLVVHFVFFISIATATRPLLRLVCGTVRNVCPNVGLLMEELVKSRVPINGYRFESRQYFLKNIFLQSFLKRMRRHNQMGKDEWKTLDFFVLPFSPVSVRYKSQVQSKYTFCWSSLPPCVCVWVCVDG